MSAESQTTEQPSRLRGWGNLVLFSLVRHGLTRLMVWVSLGLVAFMTFLVALNTQAGRWGMSYWRYPNRRGHTFAFYDDFVSWVAGLYQPDGPGGSVPAAVSGALRAALANTGFFVYSEWVVFSVFATFLLPLWSLTFGTEAVARERESGTLIWVLARPLPRWSVYLAKYLAVLPWALGLNLGGFAVVCLAAGAPGRLALQLYWPAVLWGTLAFCSLFSLLGVWFRRAAIVAILYSFFLETLVGNLPGLVKRASVSFYVRSMMYEAGGSYGVAPERADLYLPVGGATACAVLAGITVVLVAVGMTLFSRSEYLDLD